jgi:4-phospho-D-threonate 3-dehydrogenase / 4-phospho-D-erythronate 3-dehydrogenase
MELPVIAITMGDPAGVGPEIIVKTLMEIPDKRNFIPLVVGEKRYIDRAARICSLFPKLREVKNPKDIQNASGGEIFIHDPRGKREDKENENLLPFGVINQQGGKAAYSYIKKAVELCQIGIADAIATAPIHKESLKAADVPYIGHTEILGGLTDTADPLTMFEVEGMRIFFLSRHVSLRKACDMVQRERLSEYLRRCVEALRSLGIETKSNEKRLAVAGLNPHCGEHGLFGDEEVQIITPAVEAARKEGLPVTGPIGADSVFHLARIGKYAAVLSLYHDQGHIAAKTYNFHRTISLTLGLPFLRTSVDHGTAFDIAGKGEVNHESMLEAVRLAVRYGIGYRQFRINGKT